MKKNITKFYNGLVRKFFPNIRENNIKNYPQYNKSSEKTFIKINDRKKSFVIKIIRWGTPNTAVQMEPNM